MFQLMAAIVFVTVALVSFVVLMGIDQRNARGRTMQQRLAAIDQAAQREPSQELALLRDELLSGIPALNKVLARSSKIGRLQRLLLQADLSVRAGKFLLICVATAAFAAIV